MTRQGAKRARGMKKINFCISWSMVNTREVAEIGNGRIEEEQYTKYMSIFNLELNL